MGYQCQIYRETLVVDGKGQDPDSVRGRVLAVIFIATILALSIWFSTNAIGPALEREKGFSTSNLSWLTIAVQSGFVVGTLISAFLNSADRIPARVLFAVATGVGALLNLAVVPLDGFGLVFLVRFGTGVALAGVCPPALKIVSGWFQGGQGCSSGNHDCSPVHRIGVAAPASFGLRG